REPQCLPSSPQRRSSDLTCGMLTGCESPVPFYRPGEGAPDGPVVGLGGPAPYLSARLDGAPGAGSGASPGTPGGVPTAPAGRNEIGRAHVSTPVAWKCSR